MASNGEFRFKDLPAEVRDEIYRNILCTWQGPKSTWDEERKVVVVPDTVAMYRRKPDTSILLANRQIGRESKGVMLKGNLFVRVVTRGIPIHPALIPKQVPIVSIDPKRIKSFKGFVMTHEITMAGGQLPCELMIRHCDLDLFCQALAAADTIIPGFSGKSKHRVTIHNPFKDTSTPKYLDVKNQERLLAPYLKHFHGFPSFKVNGNVTPRLAKDLSASVAKEPIPDPEELLAEIIQHKDLGNEYYRAKDAVMASETWSKMLIKLLRLSQSGSVWARLKTAAGTDFANRVTELFFQLSSNLAANTLDAMREADAKGDHDLAEQYSGSLYNAAQRATQAPQTFGTDWRPTPQQEAKLCYRLAMAHRLARDNLRVAEQVINYAATALPGDAAIQREKEEIARWRARGGGSTT